MGIDYQYWSFWILTLISLSLAIKHDGIIDDFQNHASAVKSDFADCYNEGEPVITNVENATNFNCKCTNGIVICDNQCPSTVGCHFIVKDNRAPERCKVCKECVYKGKTYLSNTEWTDPSNPCKVMRCEAGIVTVSDMHCYTPCTNSLPPEPGKCCRTCPVCQINGQMVEENREVETQNDSCLKCRCSRGQLTCAKKACPVLQCPEIHRVTDPDECCPKCVDVWEPLIPPGWCPFRREVYRDGFHLKADPCTECQCLNGTSICSRKTCPILDCPQSDQKLRTGHCCPVCQVTRPLTDQFTSECHYLGHTFKNGMVWKINDCSSCKCNQGSVSCARVRCNNTCPSGMRTILIPGECCPRCIEKDGTCMAFGDPHYKTFDGKIYTFRGMGKYQLIEDCENHSFSIKVANEASKHMKSAITKRVAITFGDIRLNLQQRMRVKYNGQKLTLPFTKEGQFRVKKEDNAIEVRLQNDVVILWNGRSFLEVTVPPNYKGKLCGLCGNFNGHVKDDLRTKSGKIVNDDLVGFGSSWCVGKKSDCAKRMRYNITRSNTKRCEYLNKHAIFEKCESKLSDAKYFAACKMDMLSCVHKKCYCESVTAYARECQRLGVTLSDWQSFSHCNAQSPHKTSHPTHHRPKPPKPERHPGYSTSSEEFRRLVKMAKNKAFLQSRTPIPVI